MRLLKQEGPRIGAPTGRRLAVPTHPLTRYCGLFVLPLLTGSALAASALSSDAIEWELSQGVVVDRGESTVLPQGTLTQGFTIEAKATADGGVIPQGTLRLTLSAFTPSSDLPGQRAGYCYVQGKWTVTDQASTGSAKHSPGVIAGTLSAELNFDPTAELTTWSAKATLPMTTITPVGAEELVWARGAGRLTLSAELEGELELAMDVWPPATAAK